ncbi:MAG: glycosyltransferase [Acidobacteriota bacterium]
MARLLIVTDGLRSVVYPAVELGRRLAAAGHAVTIAGPSSARDPAERLGLAYRPLAPSRLPDFAVRDARRGLLDRLRHLGARRADALESLATDDFVATLRAVDPELVLLDGELHAQIVVALGRFPAASGRVVLLNSFCAVWRRPGLPPPHRLVRPGIGWRGSRPSIALLWLALRLRKAWRRRAQGLRRIGCDLASLLHHLARVHGVDLRREIDTGHWLIPWTYRRLPVFSLHSRAFDFPHEPPPQVTYLGPMMLRARGGTPTDARVEQLLAARRADPSLRLLYAAFGSAFTADRRLLRALVHVVDERPHWRLLISLGGTFEPEELERQLGPLPERVLAARWLPQLRVLRRADVAIVHGGINTIDECVLHGVPMLVYCGFETDMAGNAMRVEHWSLGLVGDPRRDDSAAMRGHLDRLLDPPPHRSVFRKRVAAMRRHYLADRRERVAERAVARQLADASASPRAERETPQ